VHARGAGALFAALELVLGDAAGQEGRADARDPSDLTLERASEAVGRLDVDVSGKEDQRLELAFVHLRHDLAAEGAEAPACQGAEPEDEQHDQPAEAKRVGQERSIDPLDRRVDRLEELAQEAEEQGERPDQETDHELAEAERVHET
jgi:hypothetical protein